MNASDAAVTELATALGEHGGGHRAQRGGPHAQVTGCAARL
jgi:hypothetical protein